MTILVTPEVMASEDLKSHNEDTEENNRMKHRIVVLGVGNPLLKDEGIGVHVINALEKMNLPPNVELTEGGTSSIDLISWMEGADKLIIVDAVKGGGEPGTIYRFTPDDIRIERDAPISLHQINLVDTLKIAESLGKKPKLTLIIGVEPKEIDWGMELSQEVNSKMGDVLGLVLSEIN